MKWSGSLLALMAALLFPLLAQPTGPSAVRFQAVDIFVDSGNNPLAAYQLKFRAATGSVKIVGVEGGEHPAFKEAPFYDPKAIQGEQVILAAFSIAPGNNLPTGKTRVATVHLQIHGDATPEFEIKSQTAATAGARAVAVEVSFAERKSE